MIDSTLNKLNQQSCQLGIHLHAVQTLVDG